VTHYYLPRYRYYDYIVAASITTLLCANLIGPAKVINVAIPWLGTVVMSAGIAFLPLFYTLGKIVTEVYGYMPNRRVIWAGFAASAFAALLSMLIVGLTPAPDTFSGEYQKHLEAIFGNTPRVVLASLASFLCGSFVNSHAMAMLKSLTRGRHLLMRTFGATLCSQFVDSCLFYTIAFYGIWPQGQLLAVIVAQYVLKVGCEVLMSPATCALVRLLKEKESEVSFGGNAQLLPLPLGTNHRQATKNN